MIQIIGGGLAGSEAAWQAASCGTEVTLYEMRPSRPTSVHHTDHLAELVCSNSFRGTQLENAVGLLKEEMRRSNSLIIRVADDTRVPAGGALAVDRERFARGVTEALESHPLVTIRREEVLRIPETPSPVIVGDRSADLGRAVGGDRAPGWQRTLVLLRRDQPDCVGRVDRPEQDLRRLSLRPRYAGRPDVIPRLAR